MNSPQYENVSQSLTYENARVAVNTHSDTAYEETVLASGRQTYSGHQITDNNNANTIYEHLQ